MTGRKRRLAVGAGLALVLALSAVAAPAGADAAKKRRPNKPKVFRNNIPAAIPDRGAGVNGFFGVLDSWIRVGRAMRGREIADVDAGFSISGPVNQLEDIDVYLQSPDGTFVPLANDNEGQPGTTSYGAGQCRNGAIRFSDETLNFISNAEPPPIQPGEIFSPWVATVQPQGFFPLATMDGGKARGRWTLHVEDDQAGDTFTLHCWWVRIKPRRAR